MDLTEEELELLEPHPDIHALFVHYNSLYFEDQLGACSVEWSSARMTLCGGVCEFRPGGGCRIKLSEPLLKLRPARDLKMVLLHEMIHAHMMLQGIRDDDSGGHGTIFKSIMARINSSTVPDGQRPPGGYAIATTHSMLAEVDHYRVHHWRCERCGNIIKRAMNRAPQEADCRNRTKGRDCGDQYCTYHQHIRHCGGTWVKVKEPEGFAERKKGRRAAAAAGTAPQGGAASTGGGGTKARPDGASVPAKRPKKGEAPGSAGRPITDFFHTSGVPGAPPLASGGSGAPSRDAPGGSGAASRAARAPAVSEAAALGRQAAGTDAAGPPRVREGGAGRAPALAEGSVLPAIQAVQEQQEQQQQQLAQQQHQQQQQEPSLEERRRLLAQAAMRRLAAVGGPNSSCPLQAAAATSFSEQHRAHNAQQQQQQQPQGPQQRGAQQQAVAAAEAGAAACDVVDLASASDDEEAQQRGLPHLESRRQQAQQAAQQDRQQRQQRQQQQQQRAGQPPRQSYPSPALPGPTATAVEGGSHRAQHAAGRIPLPHDAPGPSSSSVAAAAAGGGGQAASGATLACPVCGRELPAAELSNAQLNAHIDECLTLAALET